MAAALPLLDSASELFRQLNLIDQDTIVPLTTNMEDAIVEEPLVVLDTPDRVPAKNKGTGRNGLQLEEAAAMNVDQDKRIFSFEEVDDGMQVFSQKDGRISTEKQAKVVSMELDCDAASGSSLMWSKTPPRRRRSILPSNKGRKCLLPVALGGERGSSYAQNIKDSVSAFTSECPSKPDATDDNIDVVFQSRYACASRDMNKLNLTGPIRGSACNDNMSCNNNTVDTIAMEKDTESCSKSQHIDSKNLNTKGRLSLNRRNTSLANVHPVSSSVTSRCMSDSPVTVLDNSVISFPGSCQSKTRGVDTSRGAHLVDRGNQCSDAVDANIPHTVKGLCSANEKVAALNEGDNVKLSPVCHHRNSPSTSKFAGNGGRPSFVRCNSDRPKIASSGVFTYVEKPKAAVSSAHHECAQPDARHPSDSCGGFKRGKMDSGSLYCVKSTRDIEPHQVTGRKSGFDFKLDRTSLNGDKNEKYACVPKITNHQLHINIDGKGANKVQDACTRSPSHSKMNDLSSLHSAVLSRNSSGRMLVRNGCISPLNISRMNRVSREGNKSVLENKQGDLGDSNASGRLVVSKDSGIKPCSEGQVVDKKKGKVVMVDSSVDDVSFDDQSHSLGREDLPFSGVLVGGQRNPGTHDTCANDMRDRSITCFSSNAISLVSPNKEDQHSLDSLDHVHRKIVSVQDNFKNDVHVNIDSDYNVSGTAVLESKSSVDSFPDTSTMFLDKDLTNERKGRGRQLMKRQRRSQFTDSLTSGNSRTSYHGPDVAHLQMLRQPSRVSSARNSRNHRANSLFENAIEIDDSPLPRINSNRSASNADSTNEDDNGERARQMEADELLAWQLQEQFDQELTGINRTEIDASIAWTLQQEENVQHVPSTSSTTTEVSFHRNPATSNVSMPFRLQSSNGSSVWSTRRSRLAHLRRGVHYRSSARPSRAPFNFPSNMTLAMRLNLLEALDVMTGEDGASTVDRLFRTDRDFNENDYELLLALDNENDSHTGAPVDQINRLPLSQIQVKDHVAEPCAVCLETPSAGDHMRHLPCLHKFHKDEGIRDVATLGAFNALNGCIDPWLRRRPSCPICKSSIGG